jgi:uncharacterized protein YndB with AHSA1/START domain
MGLHHPIEEVPMIERQVILPASREDVWDALTAPERLRAWFGAQVDWELRPGGTARFRTDEGSDRAGVVDTVTANRILRFRWWPAEDADEPESEVTYTLEDVPEGTRLTVTESPAEPPETAGTQAQAQASASASASATAANGCDAWDLRLLGLWLQAVARVPAAV